jgi:hypothetical protein
MESKEIHIGIIYLGKFNFLFIISMLTNLISWSALPQTALSLSLNTCLSFLRFTLPFYVQWAGVAQSVQRLDTGLIDLVVWPIYATTPPY